MVSALRNAAFGLALAAIVMLPGCRTSQLPPPGDPAAMGGYEEEADMGAARPVDNRLARRVATLQARSNLTIGPEDVFQISVKDHPELDVTVTVDPWGFVKLPYVNDVEVEGLTKPKLEETLTKIYSDFFVKPPVVKVTMMEYNSRAIFILGEVNNQGRYPLIRGKQMSLRDAIISAELPTERAATWRVFVIRQTEDGPVFRHINLYKVLYRGRLENDIPLQAGDIVYVPMKFFDRITTSIGRILGPIVGIGRSAVSSVVTTTVP